MGMNWISMLQELNNDPKYNKRTNGKKWTKVPIIPQITRDNENI